MTSFRKIGFKKRIDSKNYIKGTSPSLYQSQLLISSGIPHFDDLIGGGIPVGSLLLINEDEYGAYSKYILKYYLAEGVACNHNLFVSSENTSTKEIVKTLPSIVNKDIDDYEDEAQDKKMTIAWRYENLKKSSFSSGHQYFGHYFDLSKNIDENLIDESKIIHWLDNNCKVGASFQETAYWDLLISIKKKLEEEKLFASQIASERNILRIGLHHFNSPSWQYDFNDDSSKNSIYFLQFMYYLRALIRNAYATCMITLPFTTIKKELIEKCIHLSDIAIQLQSFAGTEFENATPYKDYHGFFVIQKLAAINGLTSYNLQQLNLVFKLKRKKLLIKEFNLPPSLSQSEKNEPMKNCTSSSLTNTSKLDF